MGGVIVTLHFSIEHSNHWGSPTLWVKKLDTPVCPRQGDKIMLFDYSGETNDGPMATVAYPYWNTDGTVGIDLEHYVVDPGPHMRPHVGQPSASGMLNGWYTEWNGDLTVGLRRGGWKLHGE